MTRLIVASTPIFGHIEPMRVVAADLVRRDHSVTFLTGTTYEDAVERTGSTFVPLLGNADLTPERLARAQSEQAAIAPGPARVEHGLRTTIIDAVPEQFAALQRIFAQHLEEPIVVIHETLFGGAWPILLGAPGLRPRGVVGVGVVPLTLSSIDTSPFGFALPPDSSPEGRLRNRALIEQGMQALAPAQAYFASVLRRLGAVREPPFILDAMTLLTDRYLQLTIPSLEYPRSDAPTGLRFVGALAPGSQESSVLPEWWPDVLRAERVVVVTQGTISNKNYGELIEPTLRALAGADVLVVATLGRAANITNVPGNARVAAFVPFDTLLPHTDVLVTNGGYGGVQLALGHGVPLVLAGVSEDKAEVTARVAWAGAGINLATQTPDEASIRNAVDAVLNTPRYRARARELQLEYARHDALGAIHATIADLLRDGRNSNP